MDYLEERPRARFPWPILVLALLLLVIASRSLAQFWIDYNWWKEVGQVSTWFEQLNYRILPAALAAVLIFAVLWTAHALALKQAGTGLSRQPIYARLSTVVIALFSILLAAALIDAWTVARFFGSLRAAPPSAPWTDPVFQKPLAFYFFHLPMYRTLLRVFMAVSLLSAMIYWLVSRFWKLRFRLERWGLNEASKLDIRDLELGQALDSRFVRFTAAIWFVGLAISYLLDRYDLLFETHGSLVGVDWVASNITLPLLWLATFASFLAAVALLLGRWRWLLLFVVPLALLAVLPSIVHAVYVRPSEITIQKPYIERHIQATRSAYGLAEHVREVDYPAKLEAEIDLTRHKPLLDNVRLWDWRAFHDTVTQIQALRPYYVFNDSDVDRYTINGQLRQLLLTPRELDVRQLPADASARWINPHFIYTHGYGLVVAEAARITRDGLPELLVQDAPPLVKTPDLKLTRPELYYGEVAHEPIFVRTRQAEFNYPSGSENVETHYDGRGGIPIGSPFTRFAAALATSDWNILLTSYMSGESRMMIRRKVLDRVNELAAFIDWDADPYIVVTGEGRLVWMLDGYTSSRSHPYSQPLALRGFGSINYIRNSVKAVVDAYDGTTDLYVFDDRDPILAAYRSLFPSLLKPLSEMPADLRAHARYPETIFRVQAEIYRTYHMRDAEAFFNKEDVWDLARSQGSAGRAETVTPTYVVATLPDSNQPEFLLLTSFTPRNKDNLIGLLVARCDGEHLGELVSLQLSKQELVFGPMQIDAIINQDQTISKDLNLWNQQGSQVLRGQMLVLPLENTFLYIEPIYIQASEARMPQLKKVALAMGKRLIYRDTYEEALAELAGIRVAPPVAQAPPTGTAPPPAPVKSDVLEAVREQLRRYREHSAQGKFAEAGKAMEEIERLLRR